jgi:hypothetical protein
MGIFLKCIRTSPTATPAVPTSAQYVDVYLSTGVGGFGANPPVLIKSALKVPLTIAQTGTAFCPQTIRVLDGINLAPGTYFLTVANNDIASFVDWFAVAGVCMSCRRV